jgi:hypothetical protein
VCVCVCVCQHVICLYGGWRWGSKQRGEVQLVSHVSSISSSRPLAVTNPRSLCCCFFCYLSFMYCSILNTERLLWVFFFFNLLISLTHILSLPILLPPSHPSVSGCVLCTASRAGSIVMCRYVKGAGFHTYVEVD